MYQCLMLAVVTLYAGQNRVEIQVQNTPIVRTNYVIMTSEVVNKALVSKDYKGDCPTLESLSRQNYITTADAMAYWRCNDWSLHYPRYMLEGELRARERFRKIYGRP